MVKKIECPWCGEKLPQSEVKRQHYRNDFGAVIEIRCAKCGNVLAAYLEEEKNFLPKIRRF